MSKQMSEEAERLTYARAYLMDLVKARKLKKWCVENGLNHGSMYCIAVGKHKPSYRLMCSVAHLIAPIKWLFFTDEKLPYEAQTVAPFDAKEKSKYVTEHRFDYKVIAHRYELSETYAYNVFFSYRAKPTISFMRKACKDVNPIEFFIKSDIKIKNVRYLPDRKDIVGAEGKLLLVISDKAFTEKRKLFFACTIMPKGKEGIPLVQNYVQGRVVPYTLAPYRYGQPSPLPNFIEQTTDETFSKVMSEIKKLFD